MGDSFGSEILPSRLIYKIVKIRICKLIFLLMCVYLEFGSLILQDFENKELKLAFGSGRKAEKKNKK
jgi:hypothetical protein